MTDAGLFSRPPAEQIAEAATPAPGAPAVAPEPEEQLAAPALDVTPPAETPENLVAASFGLLRAEPDGSVVIAGSGRPGSEVEVYSDDTLLGSAKVENSGDWVFVPERPLPPGGVEITLAERGKEGRAAQSFVVVVSEDKSAQPLVVASAPGQASEILQGIERTAAATAPMQVATAEPAASPQPGAAPMAPAANSAPAVAPAPVAAPVASTAPPAAPSASPAVPVTSPASTPAETPAAAPPAQPHAEPPAETPATAPPAPAASAPPAVAPTPTSPPAAAAPATAPVSASDPVTPAAPTAPPQLAAAPPSVPVPAAQPAAAPPTIDAIEIEGNKTFFAGGGPEGGIVRLYVDDVHVADSTVKGGRWLVEGGPVLTAPSQRVRADLLAAGSSDVLARAEVDFMVDLPATTPETAIASADVPAVPAAPAATSQPAASTAPVPAAAPPVPGGPAEPIPQPAPAQPVIAPTAPAAPAVAETPATPQPTAEPAVPTMVAVSVGSPDAQRFASGKAIIRRGDNLWTIARRVYGEGIKYTTIYEANTGQIRDPDRIYPGQVFALPQ